MTTAKAVTAKQTPITTASVTEKSHQIGPDINMINELVAQYCFLPVGFSMSYELKK